MTKGGRVAGGVLAIIGGALVLLAGFLNFMPGPLTYFTAGVGAVTWGILGLVGGILLCVDKTAGGILAIIGGTGNIIGVFVLTWFNFPFGAGSFFIDPFLLLAGGIVGLAVGSEL